MGYIRLEEPWHYDAREYFVCIYRLVNGKLTSRYRSFWLGRGIAPSDLYEIQQSCIEHDRKIMRRMGVIRRPWDT